MLSPHPSISDQLLWNVPMVLYHAGAYVNKLKLFEREFTYEAMQIHVDSVISIGQQELYDREEAQRQRLKYRCPKIRAYTLCAWRLCCRHVLTTCRSCCIELRRVPDTSWKIKCAFHHSIFMLLVSVYTNRKYGTSRII
jgi:hypothetical protein